MTNRLSQSTSPYLIQHANNPVDWYEWGPEALARARAEDKPIFLSIGYAACHWCHVMAHESFEDPEVAAIMNAHFVNIKVDREQRPDIDAIYMTATMAMTGNGGWPMSVFLTPDLQPFYTGTYFPPTPRYNMPSFRDLLNGIARAWREERGEITRISQQVTHHLKSAARWGKAAINITAQLLDTTAEHLHQTYDWGFGGWGGAPKFPQPMTLEFLFRRSLSTVSQPDPTRHKFIGPALHALNAMARGGMYDVVGGGFARYSVDNLWHVPHFEKMLYDNAQLARAYLHAWQLTGESTYKRICTETLDFVLRELTHPQGGFFSSLDADSEHEEGKFYVWTYNEIQAVLGSDFDFFKTAYGITSDGNWEGKIVLQRAMDDATLSARFQLSAAGLANKLAACHAQLLAARARRVRPATDDKVLTGWNALMLSALAEAARALGDAPAGSPLHEVYYTAARRNAEFLLTHLRPNGQLRRAWRNGQTSDEVFLEDYAALINALLDLYQTDFDNRWYATAMTLGEEMQARFDDPEGGFFDTPSDGENLLMRPKDYADNATPSGNAMACEALLRLAALTGQASLRQKAEEAIGLVAETALRYPTSFARWLSAADWAVETVKQVAVVGDPAWKETQALLAECRRGYRPRMVAASSLLPLPHNCPPILQDRPLVEGKPAAYVCVGFVCNMPVTTPEALRTQMD